MANSSLQVPKADSYYLIQGSGTFGLFLGNPEHKQLICAIPAGFVPEFTQIDPQGRIIARGWRSILEKVVKEGAASRSKLERVFKTTLGVSGRDSLCPQCRRKNIKRKGEGASGLCKTHENIRRNAARMVR